MTAPSPAADPAWTALVPPLARRLAALTPTVVPPRLAPALDALLRRTGMPLPDGPLPVLPALALPLLLLPAWEARRLRRQGRPTPRQAVLDATEAAACGYLAVRLQDDRIDEQLGDESEAHLLATCLLLRHATLLQGVARTPAFSPLLTRAWADYAQAMDLERAVTEWTTDAWQASLHRYAPMLLAPAAILHRAGRTRDVAALDETLAELAAAHQLFADALDLPGDLGAGRVTWVAEQLGARQGERSPAALALGGGLAWARQAAERHVGQGLALARTHDRPELARHFRQRRAAMAQTLERAVGHLAARLAEIGHGAKVPLLSGAQP